MTADTANSVAAAPVKSASAGVAPPQVVTSSAPPPVLVQQSTLQAPPVEILRAQPAPPPPSTAPGEVRPRPIWLPKLSWRTIWLARRRTPTTSFLASAIAHCFLLVALGLWVRAVVNQDARFTLVASFSSPVEPLFGGFDSPLPKGLSESEVAIDADLLSPTLVEPLAVVVPTVPTVVGNLAIGSPSAVRRMAATVSGLSTTSGGGGLSGRSPGERAKLAAAAGGNQVSEAAVERGLRWLQAHQRNDGSWRFDHTLGPCGGACRHGGTVASTTGATALALLPFLGAGYTHLEGEYQPTVNAALYYLKGRLKATDHGGDFQEGTMYAQGISAIALCEAAAMTGDPALREAAEAAVAYIVYAQHKQEFDNKEWVKHEGKLCARGQRDCRYKDGGGWRYSVGQAGDMTVTGWQLMALKCGQMAYMRVPAETIHYAEHFLDSLATDRGAAYGYTTSGNEATCTAVGLLCRMYTGWRRNEPPLIRGVRSLAQRGPSKDDMYFNYYATQVLHHWGGEEWIGWNQKLRNYLVATQANAGHEAGSWYFEDAHGSGKQGGRLYNTCMAIMTLEVYYRYLPLYGEDAVDSSF